MHIIAAAAAVGGFTPQLRAEAAAHLVNKNLIAVDSSSGVCCCSTLVCMDQEEGEPRKVYFQPLAGACTCHDYALSGTCCHLLAAPQLPVFQEAAVLMGAPVDHEGAAVRAGRGWVWEAAMLPRPLDR